MNVVVEGIDGAGKTKLARLISHTCNLDYADRVKLGCGPPTIHDDIADRLERYLKIEDSVFDRHTAVSQPIYGVLRNDDPLPTSLIRAFYASNPVIIYARCTHSGLDKHETTPLDSQDHLDALKENYDSLLKAYDEWAMEHALIWYTDYSQTARIARMIQGALGR